MENFEVLAQLGGTVVTVFGFLYYMSKQNTEFNKTIQNHLDYSNRVIGKNNDVLIKITSTLEQLVVLIKKSNKGDRGERGERGEKGEKGNGKKKEVV